MAPAVRNPSPRWPFWLLIAAWVCANSPQAATYAVLSWMAEAGSFSHQKQLSREVAFLLAGEKAPVEMDARKIWHTFAAHYYLFRGTPTRLWLDHVFRTIFGKLGNGRLGGVPKPWAILIQVGRGCGKPAKRIPEHRRRFARHHAAEFHPAIFQPTMRRRRGGCRAHVNGSRHTPGGVAPSSSDELEGGLAVYRTIRQSTVLVL